MPGANKIEEIFNVKGLVAGLGLYAARALDANGAKAVYIIGRREETLNDAAKTAENGTIKPLVGDVTDKQALKRLVEQVQREQGYINLLFANAGVSGPGHAKAIQGKKTVNEFADAWFEPEMNEFTQALHVSTTAVFYTAVAFLGLLDAGNQKRNVPQDSQIILTSSVAGFSRQLASSFAYSSSKAAVTHLVKMLSTVFSQQRFHIRVNSIQLGLYPSEMTTGQMQKLNTHNGIPGHEGAYLGARAMEAKNSPAERTEFGRGLRRHDLVHGKQGRRVLEWRDTPNRWRSPQSTSSSLLRWHVCSITS